MTSNPAVIEGPYLRDILDQPRALRDTLDRLESSPGLEKAAGELARGVWQRVVLTGMGGSYQVLYPLQLKLIGHGFTALMIETSELVHCMPRLLDSRALLVIVSQSGRSAEIVRLLEQPRRPATIGVTNTAGSPLAHASDVAVLFHAGEEFSVSSKTALASLAALEWLGSVLCGASVEQTRSDLAKAAPAAEQYLARWRHHVDSLRPMLSGIDHLFITARGSSMAAAGLGGMIMKEAAHFHSEAMGSAAFRHGPFEMLGAGCFVAVLEGDEATAPMNRTLVADARAVGARAFLAGEHAEAPVFRLPPVPASARPIVEMLPLQMMSLALAALGGREAGRFERINKVTTVE